MRAVSEASSPVFFDLTRWLWSGWIVIQGSSIRHRTREPAPQGLRYGPRWLMPRMVSPVVSPLHRRTVTGVFFESF